MAARELRNSAAQTASPLARGEVFWGLMLGCVSSYKSLCGELMLIQGQGHCEVLAHAREKTRHTLGVRVLADAWACTRCRALGHTAPDPNDMGLPWQAERVHPTRPGRRVRPLRFMRWHGAVMAFTTRPRHVPRSTVCYMHANAKALRCPRMG